MDITSLKSNFSGENYTTLLSTETHQIIGDEPLEYGGQNKGFDPFELLLAALATCTTATLKMYADRQHWPITAINISLEMQEVEKQQHILRVVEVIGQISDEQKDRLLVIAEKCPVHKILAPGNRIKTTLTVKEG